MIRTESFVVTSSPVTVNIITWDDDDVLDDDGSKTKNFSTILDE